jgi:hypothetical protein
VRSAALRALSAAAWVAPAMLEAALAEASLAAWAADCAWVVAVSIIAWLRPASVAACRSVEVALLLNMKTRPTMATTATRAAIHQPALPEPPAAGRRCTRCEPWPAARRRSFRRRGRWDCSWCVLKIGGEDHRRGENADRWGGS